MSADILMLGRKLSAEELAGFNLACACLARWGRQIETEGISLGGPADLVPRNQMMAHGGRQVRGCAEALALTIGKNFRVAVDTAPRQPHRLAG